MRNLIHLFLCKCYPPNYFHLHSAGMMLTVSRGQGWVDLGLVAGNVISTLLQPGRMTSVEFKMRIGKLILLECISLVVRRLSLQPRIGCDCELCCGCNSSLLDQCQDCNDVSYRSEHHDCTLMPLYLLVSKLNAVSSLLLKTKTMTRVAMRLWISLSPQQMMRAT